MTSGNGNGKRLNATIVMVAALLGAGGGFGGSMLNSPQERITANATRIEGLKERVDKLESDLHERTASRFTSVDATAMRTELISSIRELTSSMRELEGRLRAVEKRP